ncbi:MAG: CoA transferase [Planctomycetes bacterium]|nr:CoA transferase [Planctomycetota bacterium]
MTPNVAPRSTAAEKRLPLAGRRVLDLSRVLAGPFAAQQLADLGAEVIKVEPPGGGDGTRAWGPPFLADGRSAYFQSCNRGKRSIAVNLADPAGRAIIERLLARTDGLIENFRGGQLAEWGLDLGRLRAEHPRLHTVSVTAFGTSGARAQEPGYDALVQALSGLMAITGPAEGPWSKVGVAVIDVAAGLFAATAMAAMLGAGAAEGPSARTPDERHFEVALIDSAMALLVNVAASVLAGSKDAKRQGNAHASIVPYQDFDCADGPVFLCVGSDRQWRALCAALAKPEWIAVSQWQTNAGRVNDRQRLTRALAEEFSRRDRASLLAVLEKARVPAAKPQSVAEALADERFAGRGGVQSWADGARGVASPMRRAGDRVLPFGKPPPHLGAHTREVLVELGLGAAEIEALFASGAVFAADPSTGSGRAARGR